MFIEQSGIIYFGDMQPGDREATLEEIDAHESAADLFRKQNAKVTMRQARLALLQAGKLQAVNDAIAAMVGTTGDAARIEWEFSSEVYRNKALVQSLAPTLNLTDAELDSLFTLAASL